MQTYLPSTLSVYCRPESKNFMKMLDPNPYKNEDVHMYRYSTGTGYLPATSDFFQAVLKISEVNAAVSPGKIPFSNALQIDFLKVGKFSFFYKIIVIVLIFL
jgi:hypothetical protein